MSSPYTNGHDAEAVGAAWVHPGPDAADTAGADEPPWDDVPPHGEAGAGNDGLAVRWIEHVDAEAWQPPRAGRVHHAPGSLTLLYGHPATGKGHVALGWAERSGGRCLVLDYEANPSEWVERAAAIGLPQRRLMYLDPKGVPLPELAAELGQALQGLDVQFVVVDSLLMALGELGENEYSPQGPLTFMHSIEAWPCPVVGIAHESPRGGPFGSRYWTALARMMWHLTKDEEEGRTLRLVKANQMAEGESYQVHLHHDQGKLYQVAETRTPPPAGGVEGGYAAARSL
jgi:hypothetical protein